LRGPRPGSGHPLVLWTSINNTPQDSLITNQKCRKICRNGNLYYDNQAYYIGTKHAGKIIDIIDIINIKTNERKIEFYRDGKKLKTFYETINEVNDS